MAAVRQVFNPVEKDDVIGITNYIDVGIQLVMPLTTPTSSTADPAQPLVKQQQTTGVQIGAAWQVRKAVGLARFFFWGGRGVLA